MKLTYFRKLICTITITLSVVALHAQSFDGDFALECDDFLKDHYSYSAVKTLVQMSKVKAVSLGDTMATNVESYLNHYRTMVQFYDTTYQDSVLIDMVKRNYCSLISCYAFTALLANESLESGVVVDLLSRFAQDTTSYVIHDSGNDLKEISVFEYMMRVASGKLVTGYLDEIKTLSVDQRRLILIIKSKFISRRDLVGSIQTPEQYQRQFL